MEDAYAECDLKLTISPPNLSRHESQPSGKKLRLSREQSILLEENFKEHSTLSPKHKWALAKKLNLEPRQIEIWFQNRRARQGIHDWLKRMTKLKRMEIEYEELKECFRRLREENAKLVREVQELKTMRSLQNPLNNSAAASAATLSICPSCQLLVPPRISSSAFHY